MEQLHLVEALHHETRANEQKGRDGDLRESEYRERTATAEPRARSFLQDVGYVSESAAAMVSISARASPSSTPSTRRPNTACQRVPRLPRMSY